MDVSSGRRSVSPVTVVAVLMLAIGLVFVGYAAWEFYGTGIVTLKVAEDEVKDLKRVWSTPPTTSVDPTGEPSVDPAPEPEAPQAGTTAWLIRIPRLGADFEWPIIAGIETSDLARGVGWFPASALPGEIGNFALAGHRVTHGEPFRNLLDLRVGDKVIIETREAIHTYEMTTAPKDLTVKFTENWVLDPVPGHPGAAPTEAMITLTTCQSFFHTPDRSVGFGVLVGTELK